MKREVFTSVVGIGMLLVVGGLAGCGEETQVAEANGPPARCKRARPRRAVHTRETTDGSTTDAEGVSASVKSVVAESAVCALPYPGLH